jgi:predicted RNA-binding Zn-ribbon protein involved in translation (DUF1610 family)
MGAITYYRKGSWKFCCQQCGDTSIKSNEALLQWNGLRVCRWCFEMRNAQELIRSIVERAIPWSSICSACSGEVDVRHSCRVLDCPNEDTISLG